MRMRRVAWRVQSRVPNTHRTVTTVITIIIIIIITMVTTVTITMATNTAGTQAPLIRRPRPLAVQQQIVTMLTI